MSKAGHQTGTEDETGRDPFEDRGKSMEVIYRESDISSILLFVFFTRSLSFHGQSEDLKSRKCEFVFVCSIQKIDASVFLV